MRKIHGLCCASAVLALVASTASAQQQPDPSSLLDVYQRALENDPVVRQAEMDYRAQAETRPQARANLLPSLSFSAQTSFNESTDPNPPTDFVTGEPSQVFSGSERSSDSDSLSVSLDQTVFDWGQYVTLQQADKTVTQAMTDYEVAKQELLIRVAEAYFNVLAAEDTLAAEEAAREAIERQLEQAEQRFEVGLIAITDVQEAQAGFDQAVAAVIAAERSLASAREALREIIGTRVGELAAPADQLPLDRPDPENPQEWVERAMEQNLSLISARIGANIAEDQIRIQRSNRFPTLSFSTGVTEQTSTSERTNFRFGGGEDTTNSFNESEGFNWSLNLSVPIFQGGATGSRIDQAVYRHRAARENVERVARQTERQTRDSYLGVISEISRVQALRQAVRSSETALEATQAGYEVGQRTTVDVLNAQNNLRQAETNYARSRYDYILELLRLQQAAGNLTVDDIERVNAWLATDGGSGDGGSNGNGDDSGQADG